MKGRSIQSKVLKKKTQWFLWDPSLKPDDQARKSGLTVMGPI